MRVVKYKLSKAKHQSTWTKRIYNFRASFFLTRLAPLLRGTFAATARPSPQARTLAMVTSLPVVTHQVDDPQLTDPVASELFWASVLLEVPRKVSLMLLRLPLV